MTNPELQRSERLPLACVLLAGLAALGLLAGGLAGLSLLLSALSVVLAYQAGVGAVVLLHERLRRLAAAEAAQREALAGREHALFAAGEGSAEGERARVLRHFERIGLPLVTLLLALAAVGGGVALWLVAVAGQDRGAAFLPLPVVVLLLLGAFGFFLLGKYLVGVSFSSRRPGLAVCGEQSLLAALLLSLCGAAGIIAELLLESETRFSQLTPLFLVRGLALVLGIIGLDLLFGLLLELYRPRGRGEDAAARIPLYGGRLCRLLSRPGGLVRGLAEVLDYQFGFGVSQTWLYTVVLRSAVPLGVFALGCLLLASCLVCVNPGERALVETWGAPSPGLRLPGVSLKWPWPIQRVRRVYPGRMREFSLGFSGPASGVGQTAVPSGAWHELAAREHLFLSAGHDPVGAGDADRVDSGLSGRSSGRTAGIPAANLLIVGLTVRYEVEDIVAHLYHHADPEAVLLSLARRETTAFLASHDGIELLQQQGDGMAQVLLGRLNQAADNLQLGVRVTWTALSRCQPPPEVVAAFRRVAEAMQERETRVLQAERYAAETVPGAEAGAGERLAAARAETLTNTSQARAFAGLFQLRRQDCAAHPQLYRALRYLSVLEEGVAELPKIVIGSAAGQQVVEVDLKTSTAPELLDLGLPDTHRE